MEKEELIEKILGKTEEVRSVRPLLHMIPSYVTAALCADAISAVGGRPLMAQAREEMEEITGNADGLAVNMGQPFHEKYLACRTAMRVASAGKLPVMFDPVGAGASAYRRQMASELLSVSWSGVIKANSSELHTLLTGGLSHDGVDSVGEFAHEEEAFMFLGRTERHGRSIVLAETGKTDRILWRKIDDHGERNNLWITLKHTSERPVILVGSGCASGAVLGTLLAAERKKTGIMPSADTMAVLSAAALSLTAFGEELQGEKGYGSHKAGFLDALSQMDRDAYRRYLESVTEIGCGHMPDEE